MNLIDDECVDRQIVNHLRGKAHEVLYVAEMDPGITDEAILERANQNNALLLTDDKDFGELIFRQNLSLLMLPTEKTFFLPKMRILEYLLPEKQGMML